MDKGKTNTIARRRRNSPGTQSGPADELGAVHRAVYVSNRVILNWCPDESCEIGCAIIGEKLSANSVLNMLSIPKLIVLPNESVNLIGKERLLNARLMFL